MAAETLVGNKRSSHDDFEHKEAKKVATFHHGTSFHVDDPTAALAISRHEFGEHGGVNMSIEASATFTVMEPETMRRMFSGELGPDRDFFIYSRHFNPTVLNLSRQMAALEGTEAAYCTSSGMAAISSVMTQLCSSGDHVVASRTLYGGTHALLTHFLPRVSNVTTTFVDAGDHVMVDEAIQMGKTKVLYLEAMSNPTLTVANIPELCRIAHDKGVKVVVDNTFAPMVLSPARLGADVIIHSISKYISGGADIIAECDLANAPLKDHTASSLDTFCDLPAKTRRQLCYVHPSVLCEVFPTGIEQLSAQPSKGEIDRIVEQTKLDLARIRTEQTVIANRKANMTAEELQVLSDASDDLVEGAADFETGSHDKGMRTGPLPDNLVEDGNSGYQPSSEDLMVKETTRRSSSKGKKAGQTSDKPPSKKSKRKATSTDAQAETDQEAGAEQAKKKKKRLKKAALESEKEQELQAEQTQAAALADSLSGDNAAQQAVGAKEADMVDLSAEGDEDLLEQILPFVPKINIIEGKHCVKENDKGLGQPLISTALMDSILLPKDMDEYLKHSSKALMNRLTELSYEANVIRATTQQKVNFFESRISTRDERIQKLEEAGHRASQLITNQAKQLESMESSAKDLEAEVRKLKDQISAEEVGKVFLVAEKAKLSQAKQLAESALDKLKQESILEKSSFEKTKAEMEVTLEETKADLAIATNASRINFKKGPDWKETAAHRGDFIGDLMSKLSDSFTDEQRVQVEQCARDNRLNLAHIAEKSLRRKALPLSPANQQTPPGRAPRCPKRSLKVLWDKN